METFTFIGPRNISDTMRESIPAISNEDLEVLANLMHLLHLSIQNSSSSIVEKLDEINRKLDGVGQQNL